MAYSELIKNFNRIREYMREFYVYGFKSRDEFSEKSSRSYDNERRRLESWLGDYMHFRTSSEGKNVFISIDSRSSMHNPLYKAWKAKSFTDGDIVLHFLLFDILHSPKISLNLTQIMEALDSYLSTFSEPKLFDESTVRKKLKEYATLGLIIPEKKGRSVYYRRACDIPLPDTDVLDYFSEVLPCGVLGVFLSDKAELSYRSSRLQLSSEKKSQPSKDKEQSYAERRQHFTFKHHYITGALDSDIMCSLLIAIGEKRSLRLELLNRHKEKITENHIVPLKIMLSAQNGRQYLMAYAPEFNRITAFRLDNIISVKYEELSEDFDKMQNRLKSMLPHIWGISTKSAFGKGIERVEFTIHYADDEQYIKSRLEREKRCGTVEHLNKNESRFSAEVYDAGEMIPWIRTFICRITDIHFSDAERERQFKADIDAMYELYGLEGGE